MKTTRRSIRYFFLSLARSVRRLGSSAPLIGSRQEADRQAALFRLSSLLAETLDAEEIYDRTVSALHEALGYEIVAVFEVSPGTTERVLRSFRGYRDPASPLPPGKGISEAPILDGKLNYTPDVSKSPKYYYGAGGSEVDVPILVRDEVAAVLVAERAVVDGFDPHEIDVLAAAANICGLALDKARLLAKEKRRIEQLEALRETSREITAQLDLAQLLKSIVERAAQLLDATGGELGLVEEDGVRIVVSHGIGEELVDRVLKFGEGLMGQVAQSGEPLLIQNYQEWEHRLPYYAEISSSMCVPLKLGEKVVGCFTTARVSRDKPFTDDDLYLLTLFAQQAVVAVENARLFQRLQREVLERKAAQHEVDRQKEYYKALLMNNPEAVVVADEEGNIISWSPRAEELFGYTFEEVEGRNLDLFLAADPDLFDEAQEFTKRILETGRLRQTTQRTRRDGSLVDVELLALPIYVEGEKTGFIAIYHDLTDIKRTEEELRAQNEKLAKEMHLAGEIQKGFVRGNLPEVPGWDIATRLRPANETSGDFYYISQIPDGRVSILIADVVDKGVGAALMMALAWTLFRITPQQVGPKPAAVFAEINQRILRETQTTQFLTAFYGILDPESGRLVYANAGHNPPLVVPRSSRSAIRKLKSTGMPLGVLLENDWAEKQVELDGEEMLVLYTDGIIEGVNPRLEMYGEKRLQQVLRGKARLQARHVLQAMFDSLDDFVGEQAQSDDIALVVVKRAR